MTPSEVSAVRRVFDVEELVVGILSFVGVRDLLRLKRVSRAFHATISSPALRPSLFLSSGLGEEPTNIWIFDSQSKTLTKSPKGQQIVKGTLEKRLCVVNDAMFEEPQRHEIWVGDQEYPYPLSWSFLAWRKSLDLSSLNSARGGAMYLPQPPIKVAKMHRKYVQEDGTTSHVTLAVHNRSGLTGADIMDGMAKSWYAPASRLDFPRCNLGTPTDVFIVTAPEMDRLQDAAIGVAQTVERQKYFE